MRSAFFDELVKLASVNDRIALVVGDLGFSVVEEFSELFPDRFINAGVAEQNMMGLAAGLASEGMQVFVYSIANFPTFRCAEQIRNDVDYHNLPVTVVSVGGGVAYGNMGYSHHAIQDLALMRVMPNMLIAAPGDPQEVKACLRYLVNNPQPSYFRLGKSGELCVHQDIPEVAPGQWLRITQGVSDIAILTTGASLGFLYQSNNPDLLSEFSVNTLPLWGMRFKSTQNSQVGKYSAVYSFEDHFEDGGFGSWLMESCRHDFNILKRLRIQVSYIIHWGWVLHHLSPFCNLKRCLHKQKSLNLILCF